MANTLMKLNLSTLRSSHQKLLNKIGVLEFWKFPRKTQQRVEFPLGKVAVPNTAIFVGFFQDFQIRNTIERLFSSTIKTGY